MTSGSCIQVLLMVGCWLSSSLILSTCYLYTLPLIKTSDKCNLGVGADQQQQKIVPECLGECRVGGPSVAAPWF